MKLLRALRRPFTFHYYHTTIGIIILNVAVFIFMQIFVNSSRQLSMFFSEYLVLNPVDVLYRGFAWQPLSYLFLHGDIWHVFFSMFALFMFGIPVEQRLGSTEFLVFYLFSGVATGFFLAVFYPLIGVYNSVIGASGAVFAVMLAFATFFPQNTILIMGVIPVKAYIAVAGFALMEILSQLFNSASGVSHLGHLAGLGFAFLYFIVRLGINPIKAIQQSRRYY